MDEASCPFCGYEAKSEYDILYHMEDLHPEGDSPFIPKEVYKGEVASEAFQMIEGHGYTECPISGCGEAIAYAELDSHLELHSMEENVTDSHVEGIIRQRDEGGMRPATPNFDTKLPGALRNLNGRPISLSPSAERQAKAKDSWREILNMPKPLHSSQMLPTTKATKIRLGTSELGPHANEDKMPTWLHRLLLTDGKPKAINKLVSGGGMKTMQIIENYASGIVPVIEQLLEQDSSTAYAYTCHPLIEHISKLKNEGGFCGYRNIQMMTSYIVSNRSQGYHHFKEEIPSIFQIQDYIERAWDLGINTVGRVETGGILGTRKYIGTPEAQAMLYSLNISCAAQAFKTTTESRADEMLMRSVEEYFNSGCVDDKSKVRSTTLPAIYFQHPGHSMTVVGFEKKKDGSQNLLVFDPMFHDAPGILGLVGKTFSSKNPTELLRPYRRGTRYLRKYKAFELLRLCPPCVPPLPT